MKWYELYLELFLFLNIYIVVFCPTFGSWDTGLQNTVKIYGQTRYSFGIINQNVYFASHGKLYKRKSKTKKKVMKKCCPFKENGSKVCMSSIWSTIDRQTPWYILDFDQHVIAWVWKKYRTCACCTLRLLHTSLHVTANHWRGKSPTTGNLRLLFNWEIGKYTVTWREKQ